MYNKNNQENFHKSLFNCFNSKISSKKDISRLKMVHKKVISNNNHSLHIINKNIKIRKVQDNNDINDTNTTISNIIKDDVLCRDCNSTCNSIDFIFVGNVFDIRNIIKLKNIGITTIYHIYQD